MDSEQSGGMNVIEAREARLARDRPELDGEESLRGAFAAGWNAARPTIYGTTSGNVSHDKARRPGDLQLTLWGHTKKGRLIALVMSESDAVALLASLTRIGAGLERPAEGP